MSLLLLRGGVVNASNPEPPSYTFTEGFEGMTAGQIPTPETAVPENGAFGWNQSQSPLVTNARANTGTQALRFTYPATETPGEVVEEQRFTLGVSVQEFWFKFAWYVPANYTHRNVGGPGATAKLFQFWKGAYSSQSIRWGVSLERTSSGGSVIYPTATRGNEEGVTQAQDVGFLSAFGSDFISPTGIVVPGGWYDLKFHFKPASSRSSTDGIWKMWVGTTLFASGGGRLWPPLHGSEQTEDPTVNQGFFLGSHNAGFAEETVFDVDDVLLTTVDPGWD